MCKIINIKNDETRETIEKKHMFLNSISAYSFSDAFKKYLEYENLSAFTVASEAEISTKTVERYCDGESRPSINTLMRIFLALETSYEICEVLFAKANITVNDNVLQSIVYRTLLEKNEKIEIEDANEIIDKFNEGITKKADKIKNL